MLDPYVVEHAYVRTYVGTYAYVLYVCIMLFCYRFDFVIITSTFVIQLFEVGTEELIFVIPLRFLRFVATTQSMKYELKSAQVYFSSIINCSNI